MKRFLMPLVVFVALAVLLGVGLTLRPGEVPSPLVGRAAPDFTVESLRNPQRSVSLSDLRGEVSVINVWASWCAACEDEHPYVMALANEVPVYGLNYKDERDKAIAWLDRYGDNYTASLYDPDGKVGLEWGVYGVPETYILDAEGVVRKKHIGAITERALREEILPLVHELQAEAES